MRDWKNPEPLSKPRLTVPDESLTVMVQLGWNRQFTAGKLVSTMVSGPACADAHVAIRAATTPISMLWLAFIDASPIRGPVRRNELGPVRQHATPNAAIQGWLERIRGENLWVGCRRA